MQTQELPIKTLKNNNAVRPPANCVQSQSRSSKRIMIIDDHPLTRAGLRELIQKQEDLQLCCEASGPAEALRRIADGKADLVITDLTMPGSAGLDFVKKLACLDPKMSVIVLSMHDESIYAARSIRAGARAYIMKEAGAEVVLNAIRKVLDGGIYVSHGIETKMLETLIREKSGTAKNALDSLTDRELEVLQLIGEGKNTKEIGGALNISPKTVDVHKAHLKEKLQLSDATALLRYAFSWIGSEGSQARQSSGIPDLNFH